MQLGQIERTWFEDDLSSACFLSKSTDETDSLDQGLYSEMRDKPSRLHALDGDRFSAVALSSSEIDGYEAPVTH